MKELLLVGAGGFAGSALRYAISLALLSAAPWCRFPLGTLTVNTLGSLLIGLLIALLTPLRSDYYFLGIVGFCGGFTTFSAFSLELVNLLKSGQQVPAALYLMGSVVLCVVATWGGMLLGQKFNG